MPRLSKPVGVWLWAAGEKRGPIQLADQRFHILFDAGTVLPAECNILLGAWQLPCELGTPLAGFPLVEIFQGDDLVAWKNRRIARFVLPQNSRPTQLTFAISTAGLRDVRYDGELASRMPHRADSALLLDQASSSSASDRSVRTTPTTSSKGAIFVSHAASDAIPAMKLVDAIEGRGGRCWIAPRDVKAGKDFREEIVVAIQQCDSMIVLISKNANDKPQHILRELSLAEKGGKTIKPVRLDDCKLTPALEYQLEALHWVRFDPQMKFVAQLLA